MRMQFGRTGKSLFMRDTTPPGGKTVRTQKLLTNQNSNLTAAEHRTVSLLFKARRSLPEKVRVFEKIRDGIWVYNGIFELIDGWVENSGNRKVFKFKFCISEETPLSPVFPLSGDLDRVIPSTVKLEVWKRDKGCCVKCGSNQNLHFDHIIPYSLGGSSKDVKNIQILCAKHNLEKHDRIE